MNFTRIGLAAVAAFVAYMVVGGIYFTIPGTKTEFEKHSALMRSGDASKSVMPIGMLGTLLAMLSATVIFAKMHPAGAGIGSGFRFGVALAAFVLGGFVLHNHMMFNLSLKLTTLIAVVYSSEWIVVGIVISLVYRG